MSVVEQNHELIRSAIELYDPSDTAADHLRPHQRVAIDAFRQAGREVTVDMFAEGTGIAMVDPTGSGKTVVAAEIMRMMQRSTREQGRETLDALMLTPRTSIREQAGGATGGGFSFTPSLSIAEHQPHKHTPADVTLMMYQSLPGAIERGQIDQIRPTVTVCDEMHHVIDKSAAWGGLVRLINPGNLLVGFSATPAYTDMFHVFDMFPVRGIERSITDGIEGGFISDVEGFLYPAHTVIQASSSGEDIGQTSLFNQLMSAENPDNLTAARIVQAEVENGGRGIVFCARGGNRAHSKLMTKIISELEVTGEDGQTRKIRCRHVDGETPNLVDIIHQLNTDGLDVVTGVDVLTEGLDCPNISFGVQMRAIGSVVFAEQALGRLLRKVPGKIAHYHELLYRVEGSRRPQITHRDILLNQREGKGYRPLAPVKKSYPTARSGAKKTASVPGNIQELVKAIDPAAIEDIRIAYGHESIPYSWRPVSLAARMLGIEEAQLHSMIDEHNIVTASERNGDRTIQFISPDSMQILIDGSEIKKARATDITFGQLYEELRKNPAYSRLTRSELNAQLKASGVSSRPRLLDGHVRQMYTEGAINKVFGGIPVKRQRRKASPRKAASKRKSSLHNTNKAVETNTYDKVENYQTLLSWARQTLVRGDELKRLRPGAQRVIHARQVKIMEFMKLSKDDRPKTPAGLRARKTESGFNPTDYMRDIMNARGMTDLQFLSLLAEVKRMTDLNERVRQ
ncbi:MAG: DEAD/DEAH box helicase family protein [Patescibacteria group bacterium]